MKLGKVAFRIPEVITARWLKSKGACPEGVEEFKRLFPKGTKVTVRALRKIAGSSTYPTYLDIGWLLENALGFDSDHSDHPANSEVYNLGANSEVYNLGHNLLCSGCRERSGDSVKKIEGKILKYLRALTIKKKAAKPAVIS